MTTFDLAVSYAALGYWVFPCDARKRPYIDRWQLDASIYPDQLAAWWGRFPRAAIGLAHRLSGTMALDVDVKPGRPGHETLAALCAGGATVPHAPQFTTASGGGQYILCRDARHAGLSGNYVDRAALPKPGKPLFGPGLDAIFGYSVLPSGDALPGRAWCDGCEPADVLPDYAPAWVSEAVDARIAESEALALLPPPAPPARGDGSTLRYVAAAVDGETADLATVPYGNRHDAIYVASCNIGRAIARAGRLDLVTWAAETIAASGGWTAKRVHERSILDGISWGLEHGQ